MTALAEMKIQRQRIRATRRTMKEKGWVPAVDGRGGVYVLGQPSTIRWAAKADKVKMRNFIQKFSPNEELMVELLKAYEDE